MIKIFDLPEKKKHIHKFANKHKINSVIDKQISTVFINYILKITVWYGVQKCNNKRQFLNFSLKISLQEILNERAFFF